MLFVRNFWRGALAASLLFFLPSCGVSRSWQCETNQCSYKNWKMGRMVLPSNDPQDLVELEITHTQDQTHLYVNFISIPIIQEDEKDTSIEIQYLVENEQYTANGYIFKGGQRVLMDEEAKQAIISTLIEGKEIHFLFGASKVSIPANGFLKEYRKLHKS